MLKPEERVEAWKVLVVVEYCFVPGLASAECPVPVLSFLKRREFFSGTCPVVAAEWVARDDSFYWDRILAEAFHSRKWCCQGKAWRFFLRLSPQTWKA